MVGFQVVPFVPVEVGDVVEAVVVDAVFFVGPLAVLEDLPFGEDVDVVVVVGLVLVVLGADAVDFGADGFVVLG